MPEKASDAEAIVLAALIEKKHATAEELRATLAKKRGWAYSTVVTFLRRLEAKGLAAHGRPGGGRAFVFRATRRARTSRRRALLDTLDRLFGGNPLPLVSSLIDEGRMKKGQIEELRRMIDGRLKNSGHL